MIAGFPDSPEGYVGVALASIQQKQWQLAIEQWDLALRKFPKEAQAFWYIHQAQAFVEIGLHQKAKENYTHCTKAFPDNVHGYTGVAKVAALQMQWEAAINYWNICFSRFPSEAKQFWYNQKKQILLHLGRFTELQEIELSAFKSEPAQVYVKHIREKLIHPKPHKLNFQHIFIITYGRSGSTLLQGILNTIEGVVVRGENGNVFYDLFRLHKKFGEYKENKKSAVLPNQPWFGIGFPDDKRLIGHYQNIAKTILATETYENADKLCFGFKEIRYDEVNNDLEPYLAFLKQLFPNPAFIFLTRNLEDVSKSAWWKDQDQKMVKEKLSNLELQFSNYAGKYDNCFEITYHDIVTIGKRLKELFAFLGAEFQPEIIQSVLKIPHSYGPEQKHVKWLFDHNTPNM
jgi:tetratricopeptide (TPR) repeat protein